ncbi:rod shape-determining protein MreC [Solimicrobium silvestre]|uniref:Cell shape-determining protein MreC n=1 Tax=Solimicrobium silvestre TaxID=2099400 RepID=A0A2S9GZV6_9BURK|nr:rod shape-determining protein MreC [Solimicrobium silvestre]PRC93269.1 mreC: rod shape-determining protein MreC [Solimicrobium silvestre]
MEYRPPPLFKQGASARVKVVFFSLVALMLLVIDARLQTLELVRQVVGSALYPLQMLAVMPRDLAYNMGDYFTQLTALEKENAALKRSQLEQALNVQHGQQLQFENAQLRRLLATSEHVPVKSVMGEILYDARDSFSRRIIVNRGIKHGVALGQPVIDDQGVVGQITRVFPFTSEVTLLTDKDQAIPVQVQRNGLRSVIYGKGQVGNLELRVPSNADIKAGDILVTSGIDGIYPPGLFVARATVVENSASTTFERIVCLPMAGLDRHKEVLILLVATHIEARPEDEDNKAKKVNRRVTRDSAESTTKVKEPVKEDAKDAVKEAEKVSQP